MIKKKKDANIFGILQIRNCKKWENWNVEYFEGEVERFRDGPSVS
jgi:hypothetical protein